MHKLVLIRHGESAWNKENRFTENEIPVTDRIGTGARCVPNWHEWVAPIVRSGRRILSAGTEKQSLFRVLGVAHHRGDGLKILAFAEIDEFHTLGVAPGLADFRHPRAHHLAFVGDEHDFVGIPDS
jgi:hypothetical protein